MKKILWLQILYAYRLLKPKLRENEDVYLTNSNSKLILQPFGNKENQRISIHKRKISFNGDRYLSLDSDSIEIKLKKEKIVTYLKRSKVNGKKSDPFGFKSKKTPTESPKEKIKQVRSIKPPDKNHKDNIRNIKPQPTKPVIKKIESDCDKLEEDQPDEIIKSEITKNDQHIDMDSIISKVKHLLNEKKDYLIESDSKIEEDTIKYSSLDVFIHPLNDKYIKLKTEEKDCVTYYKDSFIFTPCLNVDSQVFKLENEDEIIKKRKGLEDDEDEEPIDTIISRKYVKTESILPENKFRNDGFGISHRDINKRDGDYGTKKRDEVYNTKKRESLYDINKRDEDYNTKLNDAPYDIKSQHSPYDSKLHDSLYESNHSDTPYKNKSLHSPYGTKSHDSPYGSKSHDSLYDSKLQHSPYDSKLHDSTHYNGNSREFTFLKDTQKINRDNPDLLKKDILNRHISNKEHFGKEDKLLDSKETSKISPQYGLGNTKPSLNYDKIPTPYDSLFSNSFKPVEFKQSKEYKPPSLEKVNSLHVPPKIPSIPKQEMSNDTDSAISKLTAPDDFLQKIKNSVDMPDLEDLI